MDVHTVDDFITLANDSTRAAKAVHFLRDGYIEDYMNDKEGLTVIDENEI